MHANEQGSANSSITSSIEWIDSSDFFKMKRRTAIFLLVYLQLFLPFILFFFLGAYYIYKPTVGNVCFSLFIAGLGILILGMYVMVFRESLMFSQSLKTRMKIELQLIECSWCHSFFQFEIWKSIMRELERRNITCTTENVEGDATDLRTNTNRFNDFMQIILGNHGAMIRVYGPQKLIRKDANRVTFSFLPDCELSDKDRRQLSQTILDVVRSIRVSNPFCALCEGGKNSSCYGEDHSRSGEAPIIARSILKKVDPFLFDGALEELIQRKKELGGKTLTTRHEWASGRPFHNIYEVYERYIPTEEKASLQSEGEGGRSGGDGGEDSIVNVDREDGGGVSEPYSNTHHIDSSEKSEVHDQKDQFRSMMKPSLGKTLIMLLGGILIMVNSVLLFSNNPSIGVGIVTSILFAVGLVLFMCMVKELRLIFSRENDENEKSE